MTDRTTGHQLIRAAISVLFAGCVVGLCLAGCAWALAFPLPIHRAIVAGVCLVLAIDTLKGKTP